ncbi:unnamed protein product [Ostreobium quekettii]|uniref:Uncharacterized protein n=1 Tax=Ostreobium quekettii TaxID=121088 RepID=A0A8S1JCN8_9CHLO|nr:unnamed protein product [Ostreobium quekettii]
MTVAGPGLGSAAVRVLAVGQTLWDRGVDDFLHSTEENLVDFGWRDTELAVACAGRHAAAESHGTAVGGVLCPGCDREGGAHDPLSQCDRHGLHCLPEPCGLLKV